MKLEENKALRAARHIPNLTAPPGRTAQGPSQWVSRNLPPGTERFIANAPGRLDVLGGVADYSGALVLIVPLAEHACVGVQLRTDGLICIVEHTENGLGGGQPYQTPIARYLAGECWLNAAEARKVVDPAPTPTASCILGTLIEALRAGHLAQLRNGVNFAVSSDLDSMASAGHFAAVAAAALTAAALACGERIDAFLAADIVQAAENQWLGAAVGPGEAVGALLGEAHALMQVRCDNKTVSGTLVLDDVAEVVAIDCGTAAPDHGQKHKHVRTATFMGRLLIDRIVRHERLLEGQWDGCLSRISVGDFVRVLRDRLPTRITGREFLSRFGETGDPLTQVDPDGVYKVRSRTEHHVYEHDRARQFVEALSRGIRKADRSALIEAGAAMYASHWSCGQRCGLGSVPANSLVNSLRRHGPEAGIFGARTSGRGCGGMVAILTDGSEAAQEAISRSISAHCVDYNVAARRLTGSLAGAMICGAYRA